MSRTTLSSDAAPQHVLGARRFGAVNWLGLQTLTAKEIRRFMKVSGQTIFAPLVSTVLFLLVFIQAFGRQRAEIDGVPYVEFLAPGLIMMAVLTNAFANSSSSIIIGKVQGSIVDVLMPPLTAGELMTAFLVGAAVRGLLVGFVTAVTSAAFMAMSGAEMHLREPLAIFYFSIAGSVMFALAGVAGGIWADKFDQLAVIQNFLITPLTFLSGTFYLIKRLPEPFLTVSHFNPVFYLIDGFRFGFTGKIETAPWGGVLVTLGIDLALAAFCYGMFRSGYKLKS